MVLDLDQALYELKWGSEQQRALAAELIGEVPATTSSGPATTMDEPRSRRTRYIAGAFVVTSIVVALVLGARPHPPSPTTPPEPNRPSPSVANKPAPSATITLHIASEPPGAEVFIGDEPQPRGRTPITLELPRGDRVTRVRLTKRNHQDVVRMIGTDVDAQVRLLLPPSRPVASPARSNARTAPLSKRSIDGDLVNPYR
jgi:hypothetical protein